MKRTVIKKYKGTGLEPKKGIEINDFDFFLMTEIYKHRSLNSAQMFTYLHFFQTVMYGEEAPERASLLRRLKRLEKFRFIFRIVDKQNRSQPHYFRLANRGYQFLIEQKVITEEEAANLSRFLVKRGNVAPNFHTHSISSIAILTECELYRNKVKSFESRKTLDKDTELVFEKYGVVPDWIFRHGKRYVCLEIDTGTERGTKISDKANKYIQLAKEFSDKEFFVVFSLTDDVMEIQNIQDENKESIDRSSRIRNMKKKMPSLIYWGENLHFYIVKARRTSSVIGKILTHEYSPQQNNSGEGIAKWINALLSVKEGFPLSLYTKQMDSSNVYKDSAPAALRANMFMALTGEKTYRKNVVLFKGEEGSVRTYQMTDVHEKLVLVKPSGYTELHEIWVIYNSEPEVIEDIVSTRWGHTWFNFLDSQIKEVPLFYKQGVYNKKLLIPYN